MMTHSLVYFLAAHPVSRVKIGFTADFPSRFMQLQSACPVKLTVLGCVPGDCVEEGQFHDRFAIHRNDFEWFTLAESVHRDILTIVAEFERTRSKTKEWIRSQIADAYNVVEDHKMKAAERTKKRVIAAMNPSAGKNNGHVCKTARFLITKQDLNLTGVDLSMPKRASR